MILLFAYLCVLIFGVVVFRTLMRSAMFAGACTRLFGSTDPDDTIEMLDAADQVAQRNAELALRKADALKNTGTAIRKRLKEKA